MDKKELQEKLGEEAYRVTQEAKTEAPFTGKYYKHDKQGMYRCVVCSNELFSSDTKFDSGSGWPSFSDIAKSDAVTLKEDRSHGMVRTEVVCTKCNAHLGHVFDDGPKEATGKRYCINSCSLDFEGEADGS